MTINTERLVSEIRKCQLCKDFLPLSPTPIVQLSNTAKIQIIGQAPGLATHKLNLPFKDKSGERLRDWLQVSEQEFYDASLFAITPMAFCYPGKNKSSSGDAAPPPVCHKTWHKQISDSLNNLQLRILIGSYAAKAYLPSYQTLDQAIREKIEQPTIVLPHPSPRNNIWLKKNPWFNEEVLPVLRERIRQSIQK
jgi:uracil-DNA glycosylase